jgi:hypothetical protein
VKGRIVFYGLLILGLGGGAFWYWHHSVPGQLARALQGIGHPNARVAARAWEDLHQLYYTKWAAVEPIVTQAQDPRPISFLVAATTFPQQGQKPPRDGFWAHGKPWYYKSEGIHCRTVGEAIRAMLYNETDVRGDPRWKRDYHGDWDAWWAANAGHYGA